MNLVTSLALGVTMSGAALAQPDPLCASLDAIVAAGQEAENFVSLAPGMDPKAHKGAATVPEGFEGQWTCRVDLVRSPSRGSDTSRRERYNAFACEQVMPAEAGKKVEDVVGAADVAYVTFTERVHRCISKTGWAPLDEQDVDEPANVFLRTSWLNPAVKGGFISELRIPKRTEENPVSSLATYLSLYFRVPLPS